ncbi:MAG: GxxExxY protein [Blastocatellales bacterium]
MEKNPYEKLIYPDESYAIRGACMEVYKALGNGFLEAVYQECLEMEFKRRGVPFVPQKPLTLTYLGQELKQKYKPDFICYDKIIVEIKAISKLLDEHKAQGSNYLKAMGFQLCLLANFGHYPLIEIARVANIEGHNRS